MKNRTEGRLCIHCGRSISIGEEIRWGKQGSVWHYDCMNPKIDVLKIKRKGEEQKMEQTEMVIDGAIKTQAEMLGGALFEAIAKSGMTEDKVRRLVHDEVTKLSLPVTVEVIISETEKIDIGMAHRQFDTLLKIVSMYDQNGHRMNVYLHGDAGSGKSKGAQLLAKSLDLNYSFVSLNPQSAESRIFGYMNVQGNFVETPFFKCYTEGGVFCFDEIDNASPALITTLNSLLENGLGAFPHGIFKRHKDFICICTANTNGRGGNIYYPERRALCSTFIDRFVFLDWGYDHKLIKAILRCIIGDDSEKYYDYVSSKKEELQARYPSHIVSPRAYIQGAILKRNGFDDDDIYSAVIARGVKND